ncbi:hypothetical protein [Providencia sp. SP181]|uniref:hypothetical protein n=1 Tax=Providencia sp. SP181 TaxID=3136277 RepID=UPI003D26D239
MYKKIIFVLSVIVLCSCTNEHLHDTDSLAYKSDKAVIAVSPKNESKKILISYQPTLKSKIKNDIDKSGAHVTYDLKNMNIFVISVPAEMNEKYINYFRSVDGVYGVQEDSVMHLN